MTPPGSAVPSRRLLQRRAHSVASLADNRALTKRSYGTGSLYVARDARGRESWYGRWQSPGGGKANRRLGLKRQPGGREGLTRVQADGELRRRIDADAVVIAR